MFSEFCGEMIFKTQQQGKLSCSLTVGAYEHKTEFSELNVKQREKLETVKRKQGEGEREKCFESAEPKKRLKANLETKLF